MRRGTAPHPAGHHPEGSLSGHGPVFDRGQVQELPPPAVPARLEAPVEPVGGDTLGWALPVLVGLGAQIGSEVRVAALADELGGFYEPGSKRIVAMPARA